MVQAKSNGQAQLNATTRRLFRVEADLKAEFDKIGTKLAKKHGYVHAEGIDGIYRFLIEKHHWLPHEVRALSVDDLMMLIDEPLR